MALARSTARQGKISTAPEAPPAPLGRHPRLAGEGEGTPPDGPQEEGRGEKTGAQAQGYGSTARCACRAANCWPPGWPSHLGDRPKPGGRTKLVSHRDPEHCAFPVLRPVGPPTPMVGRPPRFWTVSAPRASRRILKPAAHWRTHRPWRLMKARVPQSFTIVLEMRSR